MVRGKVKVVSFRRDVLVNRLYLVDNISVRGEEELEIEKEEEEAAYDLTSLHWKSARSNH